MYNLYKLDKMEKQTIKQKIDSLNESGFNVTKKRIGNVLFYRVIDMRNINKMKDFGLLLSKDLINLK